MSAPIRIGLVGCGRLAELGYVPALTRTPTVDLVAVADPHHERRQRLAQLTGAAGRADASELLERTPVDALVLATPAPFHVDDAAAAVAAGVPVLVEKPPAPDADGAQRLAELGDGVWIGFNRRFDRAVAGLRDAVPDDRLVDLDLSITYRRASWAPHSVRDDVLLDLGPHLLDTARWLIGARITEVKATELAPDRARIVAGLDRGRAVIQVAADRLHEERIVVREHGGRAIARHRTGGPVGAVTGRVLDRLRPHPLVASLAAQLDAFAQTVRGAPHPSLATPADGVAVMRAIDAARASAAGAHRPVLVSDPREAAPC